MLWSEEIHEEEEKEKMEMDVEQLNRKFDHDVLDFDFDGNYPFIPPKLNFPSYEGSLDFEDQPQFEEDTSLDDILEVLLTKQQHSMDSQSHELNGNEIYDGLSSFSSSPETLNTNPNVFSYGSFSRSIDELFYQRLQSAKRDGRYSLKIKCSGAVMDDGYRWRKYGQKSIKNSPYPRSYYRCTNPRCCAKKQVERSVEDPESMTITYEGLHLHYSYSYLQNSFPNTNQAMNMNTSLEVNSPSNNTEDVVSSPQETHEGSLEPLHQSHLQHHRQRKTDSSSECKIADPMNAFSGLLEDIVPREILNPTAHESLSYSCSLDAHGFM